MWRLIARGLITALVAVCLIPAAFGQQTFVGFVEKPLSGETVSGMVRVQGWAADPAGVSRVDLYVDDLFQHSANINVPRIDVVEAHPDWEGIQNRNPGFDTGFTASRFSNGPHIIALRVVTENNQTFEIGRRTIIVDSTINQPPFGFVDTPDTSAIYDVNGSFPVSGWAADTDGIARIDVDIDNTNIQSAVYGDIRPDVGNAYPDLPAAKFSGFVAQIDSTRIQDGVHTLVVRATDRRGLTRTLGRRNIQIFNSENNLRPFGYLDQPQRDAVLFGNCGAGAPPISPMVNPTNPIVPVRGWALDLGTREDVGRVSYAELMIDGVKWFSTDDCQYVTEFDALIDCYGMPRYDVSKYYPTYPDSPRSGYLFAMDVGSLITFGGLREGRHVLKVRVGDQEQTFADIPNTSGIPVTFQCLRVANDFNPIGFIDFPHNFDYVNGSVTFFGWTVDDNIDVNRVEVFVDGVFAGMAQYGLIRTDVQSAYPFFRRSRNSGWRFVFDTTQLGDSRHRLTVRAVDIQGHASEIGSVDFYTDNPNQ